MTERGEDLKPCPFCGGDDLYVGKDYSEDQPGFVVSYHVKCCDCHARGGNNFPIGWCESESAAVDRWNLRGFKSHSAKFEADDPTEELKALREYAHDATKALTDLAGGGSELFNGKIGAMFTADIFLCKTKIRERHDRLHSMWAYEAIKRKKLEAELDAAAQSTVSRRSKALDELGALDGEMLAASDGSTPSATDFQAELKRREGLAP